MRDRRQGRRRRRRHLDSPGGRVLGLGVNQAELVLDRRLSDKRLYPAIDIFRSGTRKEELLLAPKDLEKIWILRKFLNEKPLMEAMEFLLGKMRKTKSNEQFLKSMNA